MVPSTDVRCAIYTRKSTEENLDLDFNSLDAQREAAENYIASQRHAGWVCLADRYDDAGFSGGSTERPAFQRLLADVEAGRVQCVVVYKIDRLSRSLLDFARTMELFDRHQVSLVSVTQHFNTTNSMGRLTLNILLSFAQFEREIISERTRDKIAASRRRGKWTGGPPVLGYDRHRDLTGSRLLVNKAEAKQVQAIFEMYLQLGSLLDTVRWCDGQGWRTKRYTNGRGVIRGGRRLDKSMLHQMLINPIYAGRIVYKGQAYAGEHEAIIDERTFDQVQAQLARNRNSGGSCQRNKHEALLKGLVRCKHCGCGMSHHFATRGSVRYRYYVCGTAQKRGWSACPYPSLPAGPMEQFVLERIREACRDPSLRAEVVRRARQDFDQQLRTCRQQRNDLLVRRRRCTARIQELVADPAGPEELALRQQDLTAIEDQLRQIDSRLADLQDRRIDEDELSGAFESFEPMWDRLRPAERVRLVQLIVQSVEYDGANEEIAITYHANQEAASHA
ncbi:MAG TPA: recombinase family protein [Phycisphaerae bacterium]|nr:recombinase family protein [Phycisphaerae bacterium]